MQETSAVPRAVQIYTGLLATVGAAIVGMSWLLGIQYETAKGDLLIIVRYLQGLMLLFALMFWWVAFLRLRRAKSAYRSTKLLTALSLFVIPWGTIVGIAWFVWAREFDRMFFDQ